MAYLRQKRDESEPQEKSASEDRLIMLCDGVFAIAITLLVLDIRLPDDAAQFSANLPGFLRKILFYFLTFMVIAGYWVVHRRLMHLIKRLDRYFIWLTFLFLSLVALFPATMILIGQFGDHPEAVIIYVSTISACGFATGLLWIYASWNHRLIDPDVEQERINFKTLNILINPIYFALSLLLLLFVKDLDIVFESWIFIGIPSTILHRIYRYRIHKHAQQAGTSPEDSALWREDLHRPSLLSPFSLIIDFFLATATRLRSLKQRGEKQHPLLQKKTESPASAEKHVDEENAVAQTSPVQTLPDPDTSTPPQSPPASH